MEKNQSLDLEVLMEKLGERQDQILESEFAGMPEKIKSDESIMNLIELLPNTEKELEQKLKQKYFTGYFERYDIGFSLFDKSCNPLLSAKPPVLLNEGYFDDRINNYSAPVGGGLFFVKDYPLNTQYLARIDLGSFKLFAQIEAKQFEEVGSFPDLFLDKSLQKQDKLRSFTYAVYRSRQNTNRYGDFNYPFFLQDSATLVKSSPGFVHYYFEPEPSTHIIISQAAKNSKYFFTFNSYLLLFFSFFTYCCYFIYALLFTSQFRNSSLTRRVQTIIILLLLLAMSAVGITSGNLVKQQFESENKKQLEEKTAVIISELSRQFSTPQLFDDSQKDFLNTRLREYSRLFNTPISLFKKNGALFNTSEPKLYDFGLAASFVNPHAFGELSDNLSSAICVTEQAGNLNYLSLYTPLFDGNKRITGFINLPYFAKQGDLTNELSQIISALINVYVILFVLSIVAGLILSGYITQPLRLIKQQLAKITLGKQNEKIIWQSNDEIGKLVAEYNLMLLKLEESANLLARSERESAWREMAKQVAHEIKNPLTPMKLNLQYLQHLMKSNPDDFKERFEKASAGIIEQIDALASIATEFSNFAKLPGASLQSIPLVELINSAVHVFENQRGVVIRNHIKATELFVRGDKEQCLRVFNNILKNAVQATEEKENALIEIDVEQHETTLTVLITDNGCGIDDDLKPKIFSPNFTTKSTGSGLGLAMVKNIMEGFGGSIRFESEKDKGTTFYLEFIPANG
ncbi:MAG: HAMP domain-containing histidine kinase [Bacteroidia bacterium]|nr:HAMP domain-containing histidine kinase [Bacteroidia bacterium]